jgi:uncharacterized protein
VTPGLFGPESRQLFGIHHPPLGPERREGVVLCYPLAQEYERAHWPFRKLTGQLTRAGLHVFRFDYFGTGDSAGALEEGTLAQWHSDIRAAVQELRDLSGVRQVSLCGLRIGGALALQAAAGLHGIAGVILWEPVVRGADHLEELRALDEDRRRWSRQPAPKHSGELLGYPLTQGLSGEVESLDLLAAPPAYAGNVAVVAQRETPELRALAAALRPRAHTVAVHIKAGGPAGALGDDAIRTLVTSMAEAAA